LWASAFAIIPLATTQMSYLNTGMQVCNAVQFFPSYNASLIVMMTITGMIYYEEYKGLTGLLGWGCFIGGVALVVVGVLLLTLKNSTESPSKSQVAPVSLGSGSFTGSLESARGEADGSRPSSGGSRPSSGGEYPNGLPIQRKSSFTIPMSEDGKQLAINSLPFVDPRSFSNPATPRGRSPSPNSVANPALSSHVAMQLPTIQGGETPMASITADEAESLKKALAQREAEQQLLAAKLQQKLEIAQKERQALDDAEAAAPVVEPNASSAPQP
jgi:hypothetical protein